MAWPGKGREEGVVSQCDHEEREHVSGEVDLRFGPRRRLAALDM
jgi:hypothetical protein